MISRDMLWALLQGLPIKYFDHLPAPWPAMAQRISQALQSGLGYRLALKSALGLATPDELTAIKKTFLIAWEVIHIRGLTYRQREILIALRSLQVASLSQICAVVAQDRRNTARRLDTLAKKDLVIQLMTPTGTHYFATLGREDRTLDRAVNLFFDDLFEELHIQKIHLHNLHSGHTEHN